jgi:predicted nucleic acid-binding protein
MVLLDSGPLGMLTNPVAGEANAQCRDWVERLVALGDVIAVPEVADYEVRRELLRAGKTAGLGRLDALSRHPAVRYLPITTAAMRLAAAFWAEARRRHRPAAADLALDADMILAAQAALEDREDAEVVVATTNVAHLADFVPASLWYDLT